MSRRGRGTIWGDAYNALRRRLIRDALVASHGNRTQAARALGIQRMYMLRLMRELGGPWPVKR